MKFKKFIDKQEVSKIGSLIDMCEFSTVIGYYLNPETEIENILILDDSLDLAEIGAFFLRAETKNKGLEETVIELIGSGKIRFCFAETRQNAFGIRQNTFAEIGLNRAVNVIYAPPFYLVKPTAEVWR